MKLLKQYKVCLLTLVALTLANCSLTTPNPGGFYISGANFSPSELLGGTLCLSINNSSAGLKAVRGRQPCFSFDLGDRYHLQNASGFPYIKTKGFYDYSVSYNKGNRGNLLLHDPNELSIVLNFSDSSHGTYQASYMKRYTFSGSFIYKLRKVNDY